MREQLADYAPAVFFFELLFEAVFTGWLESKRNPPLLSESPIEREMKTFWEWVGALLLGLGTIGYIWYQ